MAKALHLAKVTGATLVIAKLNRLSRNAAFQLALRDSGVRFVAVDMPEANDLTVGIMDLVAQAEREAISRRMKEALAVAKARGVKLRNPNGAASLRRAGKGGAALRATVSANAAAFAADLAQVVTDIRSAGHTSLRAIAAELTERGIRTRRGGKWGAGNVPGRPNYANLRDHRPDNSELNRRNRGFRLCSSRASQRFEQKELQPLFSLAKFATGACEKSEWVHPARPTAWPCGTAVAIRRQLGERT